MGDGYQEVQEVISIHAPTRGATNASISQCCNVVISIHAPTRGATISASFIFNKSSISIHAPTRGATVSKDNKYGAWVFQSTLPREERRKSATLA